ncbi:hypothetical protein ACQ9ZF_05115 [Cetobacterium somerae]|uniref:hypothetical protein n=1 Tax=Cetobacterium somerae TaxID=188913 RepID=UPI003D767C1D
MITFAETIKDRIEKNFAEYQVDVGFKEDYIPGKMPGVLITPRSQNKSFVSLNGVGKKVNLIIYFFDQHEPNSTVQEVEACEYLINLLETDEEIRAKYINLSTNLNVDVEKDDEDLNGIFVGTISINSDLRR